MITEAHVLTIREKVTTMALCTLCNGITLEKLMPGLEIFDADMDNEACEMAYRHQPSFTALQSSAPGCQFCSLILEALRVGDEYGPVDEDKLRGKNTQIYIRAGDVYRLDVNEPKRVALAVIDCGGLYTAMLSVFTDLGMFLDTSLDILIAVF